MFSYVKGSLVKILGMVCRTLVRVEDHHLHERISGGEESAHNNLEELLALLLPILGANLDGELVDQSCDLLLLEIHDRAEDSEDGVKNKLVESTLELFAVCITVAL